MAISNTNSELRSDDVVADVEIDCDMLVFSPEEIVILYGKSREVATIGVDYTLSLDNAGDDPPEWPTTFSFTPLAALITKINDLIAQFPGYEENVVWARRQLEMTTDFVETDAFLRTKIQLEFDRTAMRFQQLSYDVERMLLFAIEFGQDFATISENVQAVLDARDAAEAAAASTAADVATVAAGAASTAANVTQASAFVAVVAADRVTVEEARDTTLGYRDTAETYKDDALTAKTGAETAETNAEAAQTAAEAAEAAAGAAYEDFDKRYLGAKPSAPTLDNTGGALVTGALYFHTAGGTPGMRIWNGSAWTEAYIPGDGFATLGYVDSAVSAVQGAVDDLGDDVTALDASVTAAEADIATNASDIAALTTAIVTLDSDTTTALATKADDNAVVHDTGDETVDGVKTFTSIPIGPNASPTTDNELSRKKYVDDVGATKEPLGAVSAINTQTGSYTLVIGDAGKVVEMNVAGANNLTVPPNSSVAFPLNTRVDIVMYGAGQTSLVAGSGVTLRTKNGYLKLDGQYTGVSLYKRGTNEWVVMGSLKA